jgi:fucose permease
MITIAAAASITPVYMTTFSVAFGGLTGLTEEQLGRIPALLFACFMLTILVTGPLADRWGAKQFVLAGHVLIIAGIAVLAGSVSYEMVLLSVGILGFGAGCLEMVLSPIVAALRPEKRASAMNWLHSFYCTGSFITVMITSQSLRFDVSWRLVCGAMTLLPLSVFLGFLPVRVPPTVLEDRDREPVLSLLRRKHLLAALLIIFLAGGTEMSMAQWLPAYSERVLGFTKSVSGQGLAGFFIGMALGRILIASAGHRFTSLQLISFGALCCMTMLLIGVLAPNPRVALAACTGLGFSVSWLWPTTLAMTADRSPHGGATMFALLGVCGNAGCVVMPWIVGFVADQTSLRYGMMAILACPTVMISLLVWKALGGDR